MADTKRYPHRVLSTDEKIWFHRDRFGLFIHWGLYSLAARHEWVKNHEELTDAHYQRYFDHFEPDLYDPAAWARRAKQAGMKYAVITTKHHEGFCLFDSAATDYKVTNTPIGKDLIAPFVDAFRREGLRVGFYYSIIDWHHPHFPIDAIHPLRNHADAEAMNADRDMARYAAYVREQVVELLSHYGDIDILWFDFAYPQISWRGQPGKGADAFESVALMALVRQLQPQIMVNDRLDLGGFDGYVPDMVTPEQFTPTERPTYLGGPVTWEGCQTLSGSWGYYRDEESWKSPDQLIRVLVDHVALDGNLLMNVGPTGRGTFDQRAIDALDVYARWMRVNDRAIQGCGASALAPPSGCRYTQNGNKLYLHVFDWPFRHIHIDGLGDRLRYAQLLHDASEIRWQTSDVKVANHTDVPTPSGAITLELPVKKPDVVVPVIELFLDAH